VWAVRTSQETQIHWAVRTSQETHHVSTPEPNRWRCVGKQSLFPVRTVRNTQIQSVPHRKHHVNATEPNLLMLCGETVAVCCENRMEHTDTLCGQSVPHRKHRYTVWAVRTSQETQTRCGQSVSHRKCITSTLQSPTG
jgi:hypothetical protein